MHLHIATCLWQPNEHSREFSRCYDESWVRKLYAGFKRNLTVDFQFVLFTDDYRNLPEEIEQELLETKVPNYGCYIEPFRLGVPMILVGLDTVIIGNIDHLAHYCLIQEKVALPRDPYAKWRACNGVALIPAGNQRIYQNWRGENDMEWLRGQEHVFIDDLFPSSVESFKGTVQGRGLRDTRIVYFHGHPKLHEVHLPWMQDHWRE